MTVNVAPSHPRGLTLDNLVMAASGTFGYGVEFAGLVDIQRLGAIVCKGTTLRPREGNPPPRTVETAAGMLNSVGLQNLGVEAVIERYAPEWATWAVPVLVNIAGQSVDDFARLAELLDGVPGVAGLEVNISSPNLEGGGAFFGQDADMSAAVTRAVRGATGLPTVVKLTPNVTDIQPIALAVEAAGAHALSLVNTFNGLTIDVRRRAPRLGKGAGGLSGPAIKPLAIALVARVAEVATVPIIGVGGISSGEDAVEFVLAGATAVQVGTMHFVNPRASLDVLEETEAWLRQHRVSSVVDLVGRGHPLPAVRDRVDKRDAVDAVAAGLR
ncbi:MAG: dihydroorotate dehydrogenase B catalytic subunit [Dehalococcoidia bacterium]|nr:dihydroorotate dehydrogenase B catalytic subunit [Dehalococcoidia bacterium]